MHTPQENRACSTAIASYSTDLRIHSAPNWQPFYLCYIQLTRMQIYAEGGAPHLLSVLRVFLEVIQHLSNHRVRQNCLDLWISHSVRRSLRIRLSRFLPHARRFNKFSGQSLWGGVIAKAESQLEQHTAPGRARLISVTERGTRP